MDINEFKTNLGLTELPEELEKLIDFQINHSGNAEYSDGFCVRIDKKTGLQYGWSKDNNFLNKLLPFSRANASGSFYALWVNDDKAPLNQLPVVVFGNEGGEHIVAENILQLLHLITFDSEIHVSEDSATFKRRRKKPSENLEKYLEWLKENYKLGKIEKPATIINNAQAKFKSSFDEWCSQYFEKRDKRTDIKFHLKMLSTDNLNEKAKTYNIKQLKKIVKSTPDLKEFVKEEMTTIQSEEMKERVAKELKIG